MEPLGLGFLHHSNNKTAGTSASRGHFPGRKETSDLFLPPHVHLSLSGQLVSFTLTILCTVLVIEKELAGVWFCAGQY